MTKIKKLKANISEQNILPDKISITVAYNPLKKNQIRFTY